MAGRTQSIPRYGPRPKARASPTRRSWSRSRRSTRQQSGRRPQSQFPAAGRSGSSRGPFPWSAALLRPSPDAAAAASELEAQGFRVLAVAAGVPAAFKLVGLIALSDPPRTDSSALVTELHGLGVRTVMVTGDAPQTAAIVAKMIGLRGSDLSAGVNSGYRPSRDVFGFCRRPAGGQVQARQGFPER